MVEGCCVRFLDMRKEAAVRLDLFMVNIGLMNVNVARVNPIVYGKYKDYDLRVCGKRNAAIGYGCTFIGCFMIIVFFAKYIVVSEATMEAVWNRKFVSGLGVISTNEEHMKMYCNNSGAIIIANEPGV
ncbi:hypothetical protein Tco_1285662 [Tanacetum coccineum]